MGDNLSTRPEREQDYDNDGVADILLPAGRWVLPDDWPVLAGPDWAEQRIHWDIMDNPFDIVRAADLTPNPVPGLWDPDAGMGPYRKPYPNGPVVADYPVIGPFRPGIEEPTWYGYDPIKPAWLGIPRHKSVVPNGALEWWDAPMPPAKITFEILAGNGFFKDANKGDIYYVWSDANRTTKLYTNPFYFEMIPASWFIPPFVNNGGYDWDSWGTVSGLIPVQSALVTEQTVANTGPYGPYQFWKVFNRPPGTVGSADSANFPTKVQVYSDNHGEAMVWLNGNWNLNLRSSFFNNGAAEVPEGSIVGTTTATAMADYPYFRKHPKLVSTNVTKTWTWGGVVLGTDPFTFNFPAPVGTPSPASQMILATGRITQLTNDFPNDIGLSNKKVIFVWLSDRDISPFGVLDTQIFWSVTGGGTVRIAKNFGVHTALSDYNSITRNIFLSNGFLEGTNGVVTPNTADTQGVSGVRRPTDTEKELFLKFYPTRDPNDFVVAAIELINNTDPLAPTVNLHVEIRSRDFGLDWGSTGTIARDIVVNFAAAHPLDDEPMYGDATGDGIINMGDVIAVERTILGLRQAYVGADANQDHKINMGDVIKIERMILGLE